MLVCFQVVSHLILYNPTIIQTSMSTSLHNFLGMFHGREVFKKFHHKLCKVHRNLFYLFNVLKFPINIL